MVANKTKDSVMITKDELFAKLRDKGFFWSYDKNITYSEVGDTLFIEYLLKYGDFDDIKTGFELFDKNIIRDVWNKRLKSDKSFIKTNLMIARVFFDLDIESSYFKDVQNERLEKLRLFAT